MATRTNPNPGELLIFGNPAQLRRIVNAKTGKWIVPLSSGGVLRFSSKSAAKKAVKRQFWGEIKRERNSSKRKQQRAARERAAEIRKARLARGPRFRDVARGNTGTRGHKPGCKCFACKHKRGEQVNPKTKRKAATGRRERLAAAGTSRRQRRNPSEETQAVQLYQSFHGRDPKEIVDKHVSAAVRLEYTALGDLEYLKVITPLGQKAEFHFDGDRVKLASSPDGKQLYVIGGNQDLRNCLDKDSLEKDFIDLGEATEVQYLARKVHGNFRPVSYYHKFGEVNGAKPQLMFDKLKKQIFFIGGEYRIDTSKGVSPGIEN
jgi:hypothetical protein